MGERKKRIPSMDGLRGVAAVSVVLEHYLIAFYSLLMIDSVFYSESLTLATKLSLTTANLPYNGNSAVAIFFVLSGLVLSYSFFQNDVRLGFSNLLIKVVQRYIRLALPVLGASLLIYFIFLVDGYYFGQMVKFTQSVNPDYYKEAPSFFDIIRLGFVGVILKGEYVYNPAFWTMQIEFFGSIMVFFLLVTVGPMIRPVRFLLYACLCYVFFGTYFWAFIAGVAIADFMNCDECLRYVKTKSENIVWIFLLIAIYLLGFTLKGYATNMYGYLFSFGYVSEFEGQVHIFGAVILILCILLSDKISCVFRTSPAQFFGGISFSMYLIHYAIMASVSSYVFLLAVESYSVNTSFVIAFGLIGFPLTIFISILFNRVNLMSIYLSRGAGKIFLNLNIPKQKEVLT